MSAPYMFRFALHIAKKQRENTFSAVNTKRVYKHVCATLLKFRGVHDVCFEEHLGSQRCKSLTFAVASIFVTLKKLLGYEDEEEDKVVTAIKRAILSKQQGNYDAAEQILHVALKMAQERADLQAQAYIYDCMANVAVEAGIYEKSEKLFKETLKILIATGQEEKDSNAIVDISLKLANIYAVQGKDDLANSGFKFCLGTQERKSKLPISESETDTYLLWAKSMAMYAAYLVSRGELKVAEKYYKNALEICKKYNGPEHPQTLVLLNDLANVCSLCEEYDEAINYLTEAIAVATETGNEDLSLFYCNLAAVYTHQKDWAEARLCCKSALVSAKAAENKEAEAQAMAILSALEKEK